jgi:hypothetical protein
MSEVWGSPRGEQGDPLIFTEAHKDGLAIERAVVGDLIFEIYPPLLPPGARDELDYLWQAQRDGDSRVLATGYASSRDAAALALTAALGDLLEDSLNQSV